MCSRFNLKVILLGILFHGSIHSMPTCVIIDTNLLDQSDNTALSSLNVQQIRLLNQSDLADFFVQPRQVSMNEPATIEKAIINASMNSCSLASLNDLEEQMIIPFEFRRLHIEQPDHHRKFLNDELRQTVPHLSTVVYERRSSPDGPRFCRTCRDGSWSSMVICEIIRCDAELLRATPRLVTQWGEVQPIEGGALYAPSSVLAVYTFAFQPHCKRCEPNGRWSEYALSEICTDIKLFRPSTSSSSAKFRTANPKFRSTSPSYSDHD